MSKPVLERPTPGTTGSRKRLVRAEATTNDKFGKTPGSRTADELLHSAVINLDKPSGPTSHQVAAWAGDVLGVDPVGHGGTLDPRVTGVLPMASGTATKGLQALLTAGKEYLTLMRLHQDIPEAKIREAGAAIVGKVTQMPPVRSAVARRLRQRQIYYLDILEVVGRDVLFSVGCEAGTYVRNLCIDFGKRLGTRGHMQQLRRTKTGPFRVEDAVTLQDVQDALVFWKEEKDEKELRRILQPTEALFQHLPKLIVRDSAIGAVCHGASLALPGIVAVDSDLRADFPCVIESMKGEVVAMADARLDAKSVMEKGEGVAAHPNRILMPKDTYPKIWKRD